ncbi:MAG: hypothetical protein LBB26_02865 [Puniceicoccales bacterium]|nr:hypothetical protein [Puniceicoccales bacterium]
MDFFWHFATQTNAGRCFVVAILTLGFFSSLGIVFAALPIGSIPIVGYILSVVTGVGSFGALVMMLGTTVPVVFTYFTKRDIWTFPSWITTGAAMVARGRVVIRFLRGINWDCLQFPQAGDNMNATINALATAFTPQIGDIHKYGSAPVRYVGRLLRQEKELPKVLGAVTRTIDAIFRLQRQGSFDYDLLKYYDLLLCTLQYLKDYILGNLDKFIGLEPTSRAMGITHGLLNVTDGTAIDPNSEYKEASIRFLYKKIIKSVEQSRRISSTFSFPVPRKNVMTAPNAADCDEETSRWRDDVEAGTVAMREAFCGGNLELPWDVIVKLYGIYGTQGGIQVDPPHKTELPDELIRFFEMYPDIGSAFNAHPNEGVGRIELSRGSAIPSGGIPDEPIPSWVPIKSEPFRNDDIKVFFPEKPEDIQLNENTDWYYVPMTWVRLNLNLPGTTSLQIVLPVISVRDTSGNVWVALTGMAAGNCARTTPWIKYDPTNPSGTAASLCEAAIGKPRSEIQKEEDTERAQNRAKTETYNARIEELKREISKKRRKSWRTPRGT